MNGFKPAAGEHLTFMDFGSLNGKLLRIEETNWKRPGTCTDVIEANSVTLEIGSALSPTAEPSRLVQAGPAVSPTPEPSTLVLIGTSPVGAGYLRRRRGVGCLSAK